MVSKIQFDITKPQLEDMYQNQELSRKSIAEKYGCSEKVIKRLMKEMGITPRSMKKDNLPSEDYLRKHYHEMLETTVDIGERFGISDVHVGRLLKKYGIPTRPCGKYRERIQKYSDEDAIACYKKHGSYLKAAEELGAGCGEGLRKILNRKGVCLKKPEDYSTTVDIKSNYDFSYFIGLILSEGYCEMRTGRYAFGVGVKDKIFTDKIYELFCRMKLKSCRFVVSNRGGIRSDIHTIRAHSKNLAEWYMSLDKKKIIEFIGDNKDMMRGFLCSYHEADGHYSINGTICIASKDRWQLEVFEHCLKGLGYTDFYISKGYKNPNKPHWSEMFQLHIRRGKGEAERFLEEINPCIKCHGYYKDGR